VTFFIVLSFQVQHHDKLFGTIHNESAPLGALVSDCPIKGQMPALLEFIVDGVVGDFKRKSIDQSRESGNT
jgi:hypothetical protein